MYHLVRFEVECSQANPADTVAYFVCHEHCDMCMIIFETGILDGALVALRDADEVFVV